MNLNILGIAIPFFIGFMLLEFFISKRRGFNYHNLNNSIANISIGIAERMADIFVSGLFFVVYDIIQKKYGVFSIRPTIMLWLLLLILTDFIWYWYHRLAHEVNILWLAHIVHHQSEDFNYTTSVRVTLFQALVRAVFWSILPFIGFPAYMITTLLLVHGLYPFFVHTRLIRRLGILEYILVTPSHHRVHHASNEKYLDKNYGDVFIIWDKLFGTFKIEEEEPVYGLTHPLKTYSFLWQHFHFAIEIWLAVRSVKGITKKMKIIFGSPTIINPCLRVEAESIFKIKRNERVIDRPLNRYVIWQIIILLVLLTGFTFFESYLSELTKAEFVFITLLTLINCGAIMEQKRWIFFPEFLRILCVVFGLFLYSARYWQIKLLVVLLCLFILISYYRMVQKVYLCFVYRKNFSSL